MPALLTWTALGLAGLCGLSALIVIGCVPHWISNAWDADLLGLLDDPDAR